MKRTIEKSISLLLVLGMLLGMMPMQVFATEGTQETEVVEVVTEPTEAPAEETTAPAENTEETEPSEPSEPEEEAEVIHEHDYETVVTDPTCTEQGYTTYTCECGDSYVDDYVDATGHTYKNGICTGCGEEDYDGLDLNGLNVLCLGDSITAGQGLTTDTRWTNVLASKYDWNLTNKSQGGISLSSYYYTANGATDVSIAKKAEVLKTMTTKPDVIIVWGGHNDTSYRYSPLGTWDDETTDSFKGALKYIAELADEYAPDATLFVLTPLWTTEAPSTLKVPENTTDNNWMFVDAIYEGAEAYGWIPVNMDLCGITPFTKSGLLLDNIHPNEAGTEKIVAYLSAELASYSETSKKETIIFNASAVSMKPGESITLKGVLSPRSGTGTMTFTWSSSNSSVVTVDANGKITAVAHGNATITATTSNGTSATVNVTVDKDDHTYENGICTGCGEADPNAAESLTLRYDDHYDVTGKTVVIIDAGKPTSYQVGYGVEENAVPDTAVVTLKGDTLIATGIGIARVRIDGQLYEVTVEAAPISLLLLIGQSNMRGSEGNADQSIVCPDGMVYATFGDERGDAEGIMNVNNATKFAASALTGPYAAINVEGTTEHLSYYPLHSLTESGKGTFGPDSGFAYEWVKQTGEKVWVVNAAHGGSSITSWQPNATNYKEAVLLFSACQETLRKEIAAGHFTLSHMGYFWCQGCSDRTQTAQWYVEKYLAMHNGLKDTLTFDHDGDTATAEFNFEFAGIIPVRVGNTITCYRDGEYEVSNPYAYHESFVDLRFSGPRVAQYWMCNNPDLKDIWMVCNIGEDWVWMPDGTNGVTDYFQTHYENGSVDYTTQVQQSESWYTPTTPKAVHDSVHYNQIGYNEIGRESVRNALIMLGEMAAPKVETTVEFLGWDGYTQVTAVDAYTEGESASLVVPKVYPLWQSKTVSYTLSDGLVWDYYDLLVEADNISGILSADGTTKTVSVTGHRWSEWKTLREPSAEGPGEKQRVCADCAMTEKKEIDGVWQIYDLGAHLQKLPESVCCETNLWSKLPHETVHFTSGKTWGNTSTPVTSITIPVNPGDQLYATSWNKAGENGHATSNGIRVTFFNTYGIAKTMGPGQTDREFLANGGYLEAPADAIAINIAMWYDSEDYEVYILNREHSYEYGICHGCMESNAAVDRYRGKVISILSASTSTFAGYIPEADGFNLAHRSRYPQDNLLTDVHDTWWMQLIDKLDAKLGINDSWAGSTVSNFQDTNSGDLGPDAAMASLTRIQNLGANGTPDVILFFGAGNDMGRGVTVGSFDPTTAPTEVDLTARKWNSFAEAYVAAIMRLQHFYPDSEIVMMTTYPMPSYVTAAKLDRYGPVIQAICEHYGVKYVDLQDSGVTFDMLPDNIHPNAEGMDYITADVLDTLLDDVELDAGENIVYPVTHNLTNASASRHYYKGVSAGKPFTETLSGENVSVTVIMGGEDVTRAVYADGTIHIPIVTGELVITAAGTFDADGHLQKLPENCCADTNLWTALEPEKIYYTASGWGNTTAGTTWSITFPVKAGDKIWATSLGAYPDNGSNANGVRVTWFDKNGVLVSMSREAVYAEFAKNGYITAPEGAVALNLPMTNNQEHYGVYILSAEHIYKDGICAGCGKENKPAHTHAYSETVKAPTCTEQGYTTYTCACGDSYIGSYVDAAGHSYGAWTETKAATCTAKGAERRDCSNCDHYETREVAAKGHTEVIDKAVSATCIAPGKTEGKHCAVCGTVLVKQETIAATGHSFGNWVTTTDATCTAKGAERRDCTNCDHYETREIAAKGHTEIIDKAVSATCTAPGKTEGKHCSVCGTVLVKQETIAATGHNYGNWVTTTAATCTAKGAERRDCSNCDHYETREVNAKGHTEVIDKAVSATCTAPGKTEGKHCAVCGVVLVKQETVPATGHSFGNWVTTTAATCTAKGAERRDCTNCDHYETREIAAKGHTEVIDKAVSATCSASGKTEGKHCSVCGTVLVKQETIAATGHSFGNWVTTTDATCTAKGAERRDCSNCDHYETREVNAKGHTEAIDKAVSATCTAPGKTEGKHCSVCNVVLVKQENIPAKGHAWDSGKVTKEPTETSEGVKTFTCTACTQTRTERIPVLGHTHKYAETVTAPTCTDQGYSTFTCTCGHSYQDKFVKAKGHTKIVDEAIPVTCTTSGKTEGKHCSVCNTILVKQETIPTKGHSWDGGKVTKEPTETSEGVKTFTCTACLQTKTETIPVLGHTHKYMETVTAPTCTDQGYSTFTCTCGHTYQDKFVKAKGHTEVIDRAVTPTCTTGGKAQGKHCSVCNTIVVKQEEIPALGHAYESGICTRCHETDPDYVKPTEITRIAGSGRVQTALESAKQLKTLLDVEKFQTMVVADARNFPDALSGSYLAAAAKAPILLYADGQTVVTDYMKENLSSGGTVYILGGTSSVSDKLIEALPGIHCERVAGSGRFGTSLDIIRKGDEIRGKHADKLLVCTGASFADSLSASATGLPILLVNGTGDTIRDDHKAYLETLSDVNIYVIGGTNTVNDTMLNLFSAYDADGTVARVSGSGRAKTSVEVAKAFFPEAKTATLALSTNFPDGLSGGPVAYTLGAPLLLISEGQEVAAAGYVFERGIKTGYIFGGTSSVSDTAANKVFGK